MKSGDVDQLVPALAEGDVKAALALTLAFEQELQPQRRLASAGLALDQVNAVGGESAAQAQNSIDQVVEGVPAAKAVCEVARKVDVEMPICGEIYQIMYEKKPVRAAVQALMGREVRSESE